MKKCPCTGKEELLDMITCLAPPEGEYETTIDLSNNLKLVINRKGIFLRRIVSDEFLPFVQTIDKKVERRETLKAYGINEERLIRILCENLANLQRAANKGSKYAEKLLTECEKIINEIRKSRCR